MTFHNRNGVSGRRPRFLERMARPSD
jgi:hypothetical protein